MSAVISQTQFPAQLRAAVFAHQREAPRQSQWAPKIRAWERDQKKGGQ